jgi:hypothetical protein
MSEWRETEPGSYRRTYADGLEGWIEAEETEHGPFYTPGLSLAGLEFKFTWNWGDLAETQALCDDAAAPVMAWAERLHQEQSAPSGEESERA